MPFQTAQNPAHAWHPITTGEFLFTVQPSDASRLIAYTVALWHSLDGASLQLMCSDVLIASGCALSYVPVVCTGVCADPADEAAVS